MQRWTLDKEECYFLKLIWNQIHVMSEEVRKWLQCTFPKSTLRHSLESKCTRLSSNFSSLFDLTNTVLVDILFTRNAEAMRLARYLGYMKDLTPEHYRLALYIFNPLTMDMLEKDNYPRPLKPVLCKHVDAIHWCLERDIEIDMVYAQYIIMEVHAADTLKLLMERGVKSSSFLCRTALHLSV